MKNENKNVLWNIIGATANAFTSLVFAVIATRINGLDGAGVFTFAFALSLWFYVIGVFSGRVFQVTDRTGENSDTDYIYNRICTCIIMMISAFLFCVIKKYEGYKIGLILILCFAKAIEAFSECVYAIIQKNGLLYKVGISMFIKAIFACIVFGIVNLITKNLVLASIGITFTYIIILMLYDYNNIKKIKVEKTKYSNEANIRIIKTGLFTFGLNFISIYLINIPRYAIDELLQSDMQAIFSIIIMPATFMGLLGQYIIQPAITKISEYISLKNYVELKNTIIKLILTIFSLGSIVFALAWFLELPVLKLIYGVDLNSYFISAMIIIMGSIFYGASIIISFILIAMRKTFSQVITYGACSVISTFGAYKLVEYNSINGAAITYLASMLLVTIVFMVILINEILNYKKEWKID